MTIDHSPTYMWGILDKSIEIADTWIKSRQELSEEFKIAPQVILDILHDADVKIELNQLRKLAGLPIKLNTFIVDDPHVCPTINDVLFGPIGD